MGEGWCYEVTRLEISLFKNLHDFQIDFSSTLTTILLGQNGVGKSNLLEALIIIFRDLDLGVTPDFKYKLEYECRGKEISIDADPDRGTSKGEQVRILVQSPGEIPKIIPYNNQSFNNNERQYLPSYVFGYYSGPSNRMEKHFDKHQDMFYRDLLKGQYKPRRPLFYARSIQSELAMLAFFIDEDESMRKFLNDHLGIQGMISVLFTLHEPHWDSKKGDARFWNARGTVSQLLAYLYELSLAPIRMKVRVTPEFANSTTLEHLYLYLSGEEDLKKLASHYANTQEFFKALESTYISKILSSVRIRMRKGDSSLVFQDLSEGEQQLLMVLGLLRFTKEEEALFLLDEPDTHLNPAWSVSYLELMELMVGDQPTCQLIMSTHNPLVIAGVRQENVRVIMKNGPQESVYAHMPEEEPQGMGVAAILTSELFGLRSTLDTSTQRDLDRRRELAFMDDRDLSEEDERELSRLNNRLSGLDFSITARDPLYYDFASEYRNFVGVYKTGGSRFKTRCCFYLRSASEAARVTRKILHDMKE